MSIRDWFYHRHYWGIPHRREGDKRMIQICYECGKQRVIRISLSPADEPEQDDYSTGEGSDERHASNLTLDYA